MLLNEEVQQLQETVQGLHRAGQENTEVRNGK